VDIYLLKTLIPFGEANCITAMAVGLTTKASDAIVKTAINITALGGEREKDLCSVLKNRVAPVCGEEASTGVQILDK
jgi:hypothetical protein